MHEKLPDTFGEPLKTALQRLCVVVLFCVAFAYVEAAVVVYLREIFHPDGFAFPLPSFPIRQHGRILLTEIGREAATLVIILTSSRLFGRRAQQRAAYLLTIFALWDIFYYVWLKVLINWPGSIMDWDILFLIPTTWASPLLAPVLVSVTMLIFAGIILYRDCRARPIKVTPIQWLGFILAAVVVVISLCTAGPHVTEPDYASHFYWPLFAAGLLSAIALFSRCLLKSKNA